VEHAAVLVFARHQDKAIPPALQRFMAERANETIVEVAASHVSFVSQPEAATQLILQAVEATRPAEDALPQPLEGQVPVLPGRMQAPIPAGLALVIEIMHDTPTTRAPQPSERSSDPVEHGRLPLCGPAMHCGPCPTQVQGGGRRSTEWQAQGHGRSAPGPHGSGKPLVLAGG
jgi:hypothetical protein